MPKKPVPIPIAFNFDLSAPSAGIAKLTLTEEALILIKEGDVYLAFGFLDGKIVTLGLCPFPTKYRPASLTLNSEN